MTHDFRRIADVQEFNTGRHYTAAGQRVRWCLAADAADSSSRFVVFSDLDRGIDGIITLQLGNLDLIDDRWVLAAYDDHHYRGYWNAAGVFAQQLQPEQPAPEQPAPELPPADAPDADDDTTIGMHGIRAVDPSTPHAYVCGVCGRAWLEATPAGRCPFEYDHVDIDDDSGDFEDDRNGAAHLHSSIDDDWQPEPETVLPAKPHPWIGQLTIAELIASTVDALHRCQQTPDTHADAIHMHKTVLRTIEKELLPSGSGIDSGCSISSASHRDRIVIETSFHHMDEAGGYDGWTTHTVSVRPSFIGGFNITISGRDRNQIKEYLHDTFAYVLSGKLTQQQFDLIWPDWKAGQQ